MRTWHGCGRLARCRKRANRGNQRYSSGGSPDTTDERTQAHAKESGCGVALYKSRRSVRYASWRWRYVQDKAVYNPRSESTWCSRRNRKNPGEREGKYSSAFGNSTRDERDSSTCRRGCSASEEGSRRCQDRVSGDYCGGVRATKQAR